MIKALSLLVLGFYVSSANGASFKKMEELSISYPEKSYSIYSLARKNQKAFRLTLAVKGHVIQDIPLLPSTAKKLVGQFHQDFSRRPKNRKMVCKSGIGWKRRKASGVICPSLVGLREMSRLTHWRRKADQLLALQQYTPRLQKTKKSSQ